MVMSILDVDLATLHNNCNLSHTLISQFSTDTLSPNELERFLGEDCLCTLNEILFHLTLENIDYSNQSQLLFLTQLANKRFHSTCFTDSDLKIYFSNWNVEQLKEFASRVSEASEIPFDMKLELACLAENHQRVEDLLKEFEEHTTNLEKKNMLIFYGISCGEIVDVLINSGVDINKTDARKRTPIFYAFIRSLDSAKKLLNKGVKVTRRDKCSVSVLAFLAENMLKNNLPVDVTGEGIQLLLQKGITQAQLNKEVINLILCKFIQVLGTVPQASNILGIAINLDILCQTLKLVFSNTNDGIHADVQNSLISQLQSMQERDTEGVFPVCDVLQTFYKLGAKPSAPDSEGNTCLHYATQLLFYGVPKETVTNLCRDLMEHDAKSVDAKNYKKETPLLFCLSSKRLMARSETSYWSGCLQSVCRLLMENRSELCDTTHKEESAFHLILELCQYAILLEDENRKRCIFEEMFKILEMFSNDDKRTAAVNNGDIYINTPLHLWASMAMKLPSHYRKKVYDDHSFRDLLEKILKLLLNCGVKLNDGNGKEETPLHMCRTWTAVKLLLDAGAKADVTDSSGCTPLLAAAKMNVCLKKDSKCFYPDDDQTPREFWLEVFNRKLDPWTADEKENSVLSILVKKGAECLAKALIEVACELNCVQSDAIGVPLLITICKDKSTDKEWKVDLVKTILKYQKSLAHESLSNKDTALHISCKNILELPEERVKTSVHWKIVQHLILCGADVKSADKKDKSCLDIAESCPVLKGLLSAPVDHSELPLVLENWTQSSQIHAQKLSLVARMVKHRQIGSVYFYHEALDKDKGTGGFVFPGILQDGREVAVKRFDKSRTAPKKKPESNLVLPKTQCEQIVQYYLSLEDRSFHYLAFELMEGNLDHYLDMPNREDDSTKLLTRTKLCKDLLMGLKFLQSQGIVHGNVNPRTVFYQSKPSLCLKVGNCKTSSSTIGWVATEVLKDETSFSKQSDIFSCGLVLHYLLSGKKHPFAPADSVMKTPQEILKETHKNITNGNIVKIDDSLSPEATHLVHLMLDSDPSHRPSAGEALVHPFFWDKKTKKAFLNVVGNEPEFEVGNRYPLTLFEYELQELFSVIVSSTKWNDPLKYGQISATRRKRNYKFGSIADLIRFIRNTYQHIHDQEARIQDWWNKYYIFDYFPRLIIEIYKKVKVYNLHKSRPQIQSFFIEL